MDGEPGTNALINEKGFQGFSQNGISPKQDATGSFYVAFVKPVLV